MFRRCLARWSSSSLALVVNRPTMPNKYLVLHFTVLYWHGTCNAFATAASENDLFCYSLIALSCKTFNCVKRHSEMHHYWLLHAQYWLLHARLMKVEWPARHRGNLFHFPEPVFCDLSRVFIVANVTWEFGRYWRTGVGDVAP